MSEFLNMYVSELSLTADNKKFWKTVQPLFSDKIIVEIKLV